MGFRFRKSITIIPGVRVNLSGSGASLSVGPRGASLSFGKRGTYANFGLPGTGLSYRTRLGQASAARSAANRGDPRQRAQLEQAVEQLNSAVEAIINVHLLTPDPRAGHSMAELENHYRQQALRPWSVPAPQRPEKPQPEAEPAKPAENAGSGFFGRLFESSEARTERQARNEARWQAEVAAWRHETALKQQRYQTARQHWAEQYAQWQYEGDLHQQAMLQSQASLAQRFRQDSAWFESVLEEVLNQAEWPRETLISCQVNPAASEILIDVDLPEVEEMPTTSVRVNARGTEILEKDLSQKALRECYARHIHGCILRLAGIALFALPFDRVVISGFTQRISKQTGYLADEYLLSARIGRSAFSTLNFARLEEVDPIEALDLFDLRRNMTATYLFKPVTPLA